MAQRTLYCLNCAVSLYCFYSPPTSSAIVPWGAVARMNSHNTMRAVGVSQKRGAKSATLAVNVAGSAHVQIKHTDRVQYRRWDVCTQPALPARDPGFII